MRPGDYLFQFNRLLAAAWEGRLAGWGHPELGEKIATERPAQKEHGDLSSNLALLAAGIVGRPPRELAAELVEDVNNDPDLGGHVDKVQVAGPGFVNFFLSPGACVSAVLEALSAGVGFGSGTDESSEKVLLEFVSANPTGQLHVGHARYAAYGDSLKRIMRFAGMDVTTEFYINDYGSQMDVFGRTLAARYAEALGREVEFPADGYQGDYPAHVARRIIDEVGDRYLEEIDPSPGPDVLEFFKLRGRDYVLEEMRELLSLFRVEFDNWFSERSLHESGAVTKVLDALADKGETFKSEGALWLATSRHGDDKDRVLRKKDGELTYISADIAYHRDKFERGFGLLIDVWGADHHGYIPRVKAAMEALGYEQEKLQVVIGQLVNVIEMGERKQMSKRAGTMVTLADLIENIAAAGMDGVDAARFFLVDRSHDSTLDLDLEKAKSRSEDNPVYYVQYAHARISSILRKAVEEGIAGGDARSYGALEDSETQLILKMLEFPEVVGAAARSREPHRLTTYLREAAASFHVFYHNCPVIRAEADTAAFRLDLCRLTRDVIARCLDLLGVSAPETM